MGANDAVEVIRPKIPVHAKPTLAHADERVKHSAREIFDFDWEHKREQALSLLEPVRLKGDHALSSQLSLSYHLADQQRDDQKSGSFSAIDVDNELHSFSYGSIRDQSLYSFLYNVGPTVAMLSEDDQQDLSAESVEFISKIKEIADAQSLSSSSLNVRSPLAHAFSDVGKQSEQSEMIRRDTVIGPYGGSRVLSWTEMKAWEKSRRESVTQ
jgi:hypothetical protein